MVHKADGTGRIAQRKFRLSKISTIRLRRQMGFWIGILTCKGWGVVFFYFTFSNYNLGGAGVFIQLTISLALENCEGVTRKQLFSL